MILILLASLTELTRFPVCRLWFSLHLVVNGHDGDGVLGVRLQAPQDGGGGGSGHLVLQRRTESSLNLIHQILRKGT